MEPTMTVDELYDYISKQITPEEALKRLLTASLRTYEQLKFPSQAEAIDPIILISMATMDIGWNFIIESGDENAPVRGMIIGTDEYIDDLQKEIESGAWNKGANHE